ncbi:hypothetical protein HHK36_022313 [Tetracentron sinense]|uniref:RIN4 pathogenic type III effector avirulence factor Avr cleavage site domain-containing protein n=1 Tax=Tetracentron sinense TaxID=13715 RepID=A0A834YSP3_TETSI|nr:hypothetical protein HHK36_022313 [Tetracentron sinense]
MVEITLLLLSWQQRSHVPKFGNWESEENAPYTAYFDKARKDKTGGKMINPNDPQDNPDIFSDKTPPVQDPPFRTVAEPEESIRPKHEHKSSREDGEDLRQLTDSPARHDLGRRAATDSPHHRHADHGGSSGGTARRAQRQSVGPDRSTEHSPLHPRSAGKGSGASSPFNERRGSSEGSHGLAPFTPGRSRLGARGDETPDQGAAVPKFGDWDESNPSSADGFTHIFNKVREERQSGTAKVPIITTESSNFYGQKQNNDNPKVCGSISINRSSNAYLIS